jgi:hypothetical protein
MNAPLMATHGVTAFKILRLTKDSHTNSLLFSRKCGQRFSSEMAVKAELLPTAEESKKGEFFPSINIRLLARE